MGGLKKRMIVTTLHDTWVEGWTSNLSVSFFSTIKPVAASIAGVFFSFAIHGRLLFN